MLYAITHRTVYYYGANVSVSHHVAHLRPREFPGQQVSDFDFQVDPVPTAIEARSDFYGNEVIGFAFDTPHDKLTVTARSRVRVSSRPLPVAALTPRWEDVRTRCANDLLTPDSAMGEFRFD